MTLQTPNLDDRKFQDIVSEARSKIPQYCPKWTDYNLSDPGITLIELFAWMVDMLLYRINKVPQKNYIKFMELIGIHLKPPQPARVDISFRLSAPQPLEIKIPKGTEIATIRTETQEAIPFTTDKELVMLIPDLLFVLTTPDDNGYIDCMPVLKSPDQRITVFKALPEENNAFYLGFGKNLVSQTIILTIDCNIEGIGVDPHDPPLAWEFWDGEQEKWLPMKMDSDTTGGLNVPGSVILYIPAASTLREVNKQPACWIRCRATKPHPGQRPYVNSPKIRSLIARNIGGTVPASHCLRMANEIVGKSNGTPGQKFFLRNLPVLRREEGETIEVEIDSEGRYEPWLEVSDFANSSPSDRHFSLDSVTGEVQFGPLIRQPSGEEKQFGKIPVLNRRIRFVAYRWGGGVIGNVGKETITVLKSSIPYIAAVNNFLPAVGGTDTETLDSAMLRAPRVLRNQTRAVTANDFESLSLEATPLVARAKCLTPGVDADSPAPSIPPGVVRVLLVPKFEYLEGPIPRERLVVSSRIQAAVKEYLDERRLLAMRVEIATPEYQPIIVEARVKSKANCENERVANNVKQRLYRFINPVCGGPRGQGWGFGRSLFQSEIYSVIQGTPEVEYIEEVKIFAVDWNTGQRTPVGEKLGIPANNLICSGQHEVIATTLEEH
jgi:predicted phage baseplate assembly protein